MENKERALAHVEKIEWIRPIEGADNIELIGVLGWVCIAKKESETSRCTEGRKKEIKNETERIYPLQR